MAKKKEKKDPIEEQDEPNPLNKDEKERNEAGTQPKRQDPAKAQETDMDFSEAEQKRLVEMVMEDHRVGKAAYAEWETQKKKDLQQIAAVKPSILEGLSKKEWQSDKNLGIVPGILDIYQATLLSTCWNPDSIHFKATEQNDIDNKDNLEKFTKWMVGPKEVNMEPEVDDFINNRVALGFSAFKIDWEVRYEWVDKRIPVMSKTGRPRVIKYDIKTEKRRFERGRIKNIDDIDRLVLPSYGKSFQELPFMIEVIPIMLTDIPDMEKRKLIKSKFGTEKTSKLKEIPQKLKQAPQMAASADDLKNTKAALEGVQQVVDEDGTDYPMNVYEWYGTIRRKGKTERYRLQVEPTTETFLSGKPLRKLRRDGKYPYAGGPFRRTPGQLRGGSLTKLISPLSDALNNNYNQTSDFQTIQNLPFGFANFDEGFTQNVYDVDPGQIYKVSGDANKAVYFPNLSRSLAWSYQDKQFILEMIERLTGAASYFLTSKSADTTATRDNIVEQKGETKFGIWVRRIQNDIIEAVNMCVSNYQDWAPPGLGKRVLGEKGEQVIRNLSIDTLRGNYDAYMVPDLTSGSKAYEKQIALWAFHELQVGSVWMRPDINPRGNWLLTKDTMLKQGIDNPEHFLPPQPKQAMDDSEEAKQEWTRFMQGERFDPEEGVTPAVVGQFATHMKQKETMYQDLDEEYRANFDDHFMKTYINYQKFMQQVAQQQQEMMVAAQAIRAMEAAGLKPNVGMQMPPGVQPPGAGQPPMPGQPPPSAPGAPMQPAPDQGGM